MKKKTYKAIQNRYYREKVHRIRAEQAAKEMQKKADYYSKRFREFGSNVETVDSSNGTIVELKWEVEPQPYGQYIMVDGSITQEEYFYLARKDILEKIAYGLMENDLVQFIYKVENKDCPLTRFGTLGGKLFVVPWEQMPHKRVIEIRSMANEILIGGK